MAYVSPATQTSGQIPPVAWPNSVKTALDYLANPPACRVFHNANQSVVSGTPLIVAFNSERYDTDTMHDNATLNSRITINTAGLYLLTAHMVWAADTDYTRRFIEIWINGATSIGRQALEHTTNLAAAEAMSVSTVYKFTAGSYAEVRVFQTNTSAAANNLEASANFGPEFSATWIGLG